MLDCWSSSPPESEDYPLEMEIFLWEKYINLGSPWRHVAMDLFFDGNSWTLCGEFFERLESAVYIFGNNPNQPAVVT